MNIIENEMKYFELPRHTLSGFFEQAVNDARLLPTHISLFAAIFYFSKDDPPGDPFQVSRSKLMRYSRIRSIATYHKCMRELVVYGYILYEPSWHPRKGSKITLLCHTDGS